MLPPTTPLLLGIETSCDDTAVAIVKDDRTILYNHVQSSLGEQQPHGGVVPEIAARAHLAFLPDMVRRAFTQTGLAPAQLSGIAATGGPGLIGGVMVGVMLAKGMAAALQRPFLAINHLEAHALTARLTHDLPFPYLLLLVSGGHTQLLHVQGVGEYRRLGTTRDDAAGEAFDKCAKLLGLPYPGGPYLEKLAAQGDAKRYELPRPLHGQPGCDFSFSGLKTRVRQMIEAPDFPESARPHLAAAIQSAIAETLAERTRNAITLAKALSPALRHLVVAGGVAANGAVRAALQNLAQEFALTFVAPPAALCTDNAAMVAWAGLERLRLGQQDGLDFAPRPRWPLTQKTPSPLMGEGGEQSEPGEGGVTKIPLTCKN